MLSLTFHISYNVEASVSIKAKSSALVPIASKMLPGSRVLVYDPKVNEVNACKAIHLHNSRYEAIHLSYEAIHLSYEAIHLHNSTSD
jgi:hypothetical protein